MKEGPPPRPKHAPEWLKNARKQALEQDRLRHDQSADPEVPELFCERELPSARQGIEARNNNGQTIWLTRSIAHRIYKCPCCSNMIEVGDDHSFVRIQSGTKTYDHHHLHKPCSYTWIDFDKPYTLFKPNTKNDKKINKRQARARASQRRRSR